MLADVPMVFILVGITAYTVLSGADFGAGLWTLVPGGGQAGAAATRDHTRHAIGPVWEANHVWLIFVLTVAWTCYPGAFGSIVSTLAVPLLIGDRDHLPRHRLRAAQPVLPRRGARRAAGGVPVRAVLGAHPVRAGHGDRRDRDRAGAGRQRRGDLVTSWLNPVSVLAGVLAVAFSGVPGRGLPGRRRPQIGRTGPGSPLRFPHPGPSPPAVVAGALALAGAAGDPRFGRIAVARSHQRSRTGACGRQRAGRGGDDGAGVSWPVGACLGVGGARGGGGHRGLGRGAIAVRAAGPDRR